MCKNYIINIFVWDVSREKTAASTGTQILLHCFAVGTHADQPLATDQDQFGANTELERTHGQTDSSRKLSDEMAPTVQKKMEPSIHTAPWNFNRVCLHMSCFSILEWSPVCEFFFFFWRLSHWKIFFLMYWQRQNGAVVQWFLIGRRRWCDAAVRRWDTSSFT